MVIYTDGASRGNPGPGGYGAVLQYVDAEGRLYEKEISEGFRFTTNNRMELLGVIKGLEALNFPCEVDIYSDSRYIVDAFEKKWVDSWIKKGWKKADKKDVPNRELWQELLDELKAKHPILNNLNIVTNSDAHYLENMREAENFFELPELTRENVINCLDN